MEPHIEKLVKGFNTAIMMYGVTGSGKTHTVFGSLANINSPDKGILYYTTEGLFSRKNCTLFVSYLEIYNEQVKDLLTNKQGSNLTIMESAEGAVVVPGLTVSELKNFKDLIDLVKIGNKRRKMAKTNSNKFSSRSHAIIQINVRIHAEREELGSEGVSGQTIEKNEASEGQVGQFVHYGSHKKLKKTKIQTEGYMESKLSFIDLAGSERVCLTQVRGIRMTEGSNINKSLLALGNVIKKLSDKRGAAYIPFRDSKLTRLLKDSLGGNTKTILIACITPNKTQMDETIHSLNYAYRAKRIKNQVKRNELVNLNSGGLYSGDRSTSGSVYGRRSLQNGSFAAQGLHTRQFMEEIDFLKQKVRLLQQELEQEKGGRVNLQRIYEDLVMGIEEELELKRSISEIEQLQRSNHLNLSKLKKRLIQLLSKDVKEPLESGLDSQIDGLERDVGELSQIIEENEEVKKEMMRRIRVVVSERSEWVTAGVIRPDQITRAKTPLIHKSRTREGAQRVKSERKVQPVGRNQLIFEEWNRSGLGGVGGVDDVQQVLTTVEGGGGLSGVGFEELMNPKTKENRAKMVVNAGGPQSRRMDICWPGGVEEAQRRPSLPASSQEPSFYSQFEDSHMLEVLTKSNLDSSRMQPGLMTPTKKLEFVKNLVEESDKVAGVAAKSFKKGNKIFDRIDVSQGLENLDKGHGVALGEMDVAESMARLASLSDLKIGAKMGDLSDEADSEYLRQSQEAGGDQGGRMWEDEPTEPVHVEVEAMEPDFGLQLRESQNTFRKGGNDEKMGRGVEEGTQRFPNSQFEAPDDPRGDSNTSKNINTFDSNLEVANPKSALPTPSEAPSYTHDPHPDGQPTQRNQNHQNTQKSPKMLKSQKKQSKSAKNTLKGQNTHKKAYIEIKPISEVPTPDQGKNELHPSLRKLKINVQNSIIKFEKDSVKNKRKRAKKLNLGLGHLEQNFNSSMGRNLRDVIYKLSQPGNVDRRRKRGLSLAKIGQNPENGNSGKMSRTVISNRNRSLRGVAGGNTKLSRSFLASKRGSKLLSKNSNISSVLSKKHLNSIAVVKDLTPMELPSNKERFSLQNLKQIGSLANPAKTKNFTPRSSSKSKRKEVFVDISPMKGFVPGEEAPEKPDLDFRLVEKNRVFLVENYSKVDQSAFPGLNSFSEASEGSSGASKTSKASKSSKSFHQKISNFSKSVSPETTQKSGEPSVNDRTSPLRTPGSFENAENSQFLQKSQNCEISLNNKPSLCNNSCFNINYSQIQPVSQTAEDQSFFTGQQTIPTNKAILANIDLEASQLSQNRRNSFPGSQSSSPGHEIDITIEDRTLESQKQSNMFSGSPCKIIKPISGLEGLDGSEAFATASFEFKNDSYQPKIGFGGEILKNVENGFSGGNGGLERQKVPRLDTEKLQGLKESNLSSETLQKMTKNPEPQKTQKNDQNDIKEEEDSGANTSRIISEQLDTLQEMRASTENLCVDKKLTRARKRMRQFKRKLGLMKVFMDKFEDRALNKRSQEIYDAVMILIQEEKKYGYKLKDEELQVLLKMKKFSLKFSELWKGEKGFGGGGRGGEVPGDKENSFCGAVLGKEKGVF